MKNSKMNEQNANENIEMKTKKKYHYSDDEHDSDLDDFVVSDGDEELDPEVRREILKFRLLKQPLRELSDDEEAMEAGFEEIEREEERTRFYGELEDERELQRIQEEEKEEKKEKEKKKKKRQKLVDDDENEQRDRQTEYSYVLRFII